MTEEEKYRRWFKVYQHFGTRDVEEKVAEIRKQRNRERLNGQLKPCPFCGGKAHIRNVTEMDQPCHYETVCVTCEDCGAQSIQRISDGYYDEYCSDEEIAELWNRRVIDKE